MSGEISLLAMSLFIASSAALVAVSIMLIAQTIQALGWGLACLTVVQVDAGDRVPSRGFVLAGAGIVWLTCSLFTGVTGIRYLLSLRDESLLWGALAGVAIVWLWCHATARLSRMRREIRRTAGVPDGPWRWMIQGWIVQRGSLASDG